MNPRYSIQWAGHCTHEKDGIKSDKVWGWFYYKDLTVDQHTPMALLNAYAFWGATGKSLSFKGHGKVTSWSMAPLVRTKTDRGYVAISVDQLESMWGNLYSTMDLKFVQYILTAG